MTDYNLIEFPEGIKGNSILVIDNDFLSFKIASVLEHKCIKVYDKDNEFVGRFKHRTEFKNSDKFNSEHRVEDSQSLKNDYKNSMSYLFNHFIKQYLKETDTKEVILVGGGPTNFRDNLPLPTKYKGNRDDTLRPLALKECKQFGLNNYPSLISDNCEADDLISMFQFRSSLDTENKIIVLTPDKDAKQTQGKLYVPGDKLYDISGVGFVGLKKLTKRTKLEFQGRISIAAQLLLGDSSDNYYGCSYYRILTKNSKKSGMLTDLKVYELLKDCITDKDYLQVVHDQYFKWYKDINHWIDWQGNKIEGDYIDLLQVYWDVVFMQRWKDDKVDVRKLLITNGIIDE